MVRAAIAGSVLVLGLVAGNAGASAQTAIDLADIFPTENWTVATIAGRVDVDCIATFTDPSGGPLGYEVTFANGARTGEFRFTWGAENQIVAYTLGPPAAGTSLRSFRVVWTDEASGTERSTLQQVDLGAALAFLADGSAERPLAAALEFVWAERFCRGMQLAAAH